MDEEEAEQLINEIADVLTNDFPFDVAYDIDGTPLLGQTTDEIFYGPGGFMEFGAT